MKDIVGKTVVALLVLGCSAGRAECAGRRLFRGNLHTHTLWSDGLAFPEQAVRLYAENGYDFLALSDHDVYQAGEKTQVFGAGKGQKPPELLAELKRVWPDAGATVAERDGAKTVRLATMDELRRRFERPGRFLLIDGVEGDHSLTGADGAKRQVHVNYLNVPGVPDVFATAEARQSRGEDFSAVIRRLRLSVEDEAKRKGRDPLFVVNHPHWCWYDVQAHELIDNPEIRFFEVCNGGGIFPPPPGYGGTGWDNDILWDVVNAFRARRGQPLLYGMGSDDTHKYFGLPGHWPTGGCSPFNAWNLVRADELSVAALFRAFRAGDFVACEGVEPSDFSFDAATGTLSVSAKGCPRTALAIEFIVTKKDFPEEPVRVFAADPLAYDEGTRRTFRRTFTRYDERKIGVVAKRVTGAIGAGISGSYTLQPDDLYVRARLICPLAPAVNGQYMHPVYRVAWTQPYAAALVGRAGGAGERQGSRRAR